MTQTPMPAKAMILGCSGLSLTAEEKAFYHDEQPWGFIVFARNLQEPAQICDLVAEMRDTVGGRNAPILIDQEGGRVQRIREPIAPRYPSGAELGELYRRDRTLGLRAAWLMSRLHAFDLIRLGINVDCLPVLDVPVEGASNVIGDRAYGNDPETVGAMGEAAAAGLKSGGVLPVMKHVPGHGRGMADSHHELPVVNTPLAELEAHDFPPFKRLHNELMAMSAHVVYSAIDPDHPASTSNIVIDQIIRGSIGFDGLLMSDDVSMNALKGTLGERTAAIVAGGGDVVLHCNGLMGEMRAVAAEVPLLAGKARARADAVEAAFGTTDAAEEAAIRAEFDSLRATA
ncbi:MULTISPECIES: beta-N-acetylhexosaminidase [Alphaproteobacteria]|uniref:beta-N-acetylhexosaminidase n=2 Tax=Alphaproteobacteria TaxID=28211 RepID=A0A512HHF4_9HYPH|nr:MULTISPECIES: beta-N-acetylhexosaminidase [Alphaproteobacteria]GEO84878.1 beta-N-acetylhexosaminidase [Ciceribacter naphthalenivorans]GLR22812.1 beta-N-acetylhexosaminidase [Ciceribacter naphthalenivorans]GLT05668.1 beta-N-acetylhexosaminidase [Sphingomonas psychrolutea]